jgi:predicted ArsR family transcriptional regulator
LHIDQLPDSRRAILETLKQHGQTTIARLAAELRLTGEAVRQQLLQLRREGWIEASETERPRIGRPATSYRLTVKGDHLFPKQYDSLLVSLLDAITAELGNDAVQRLLVRLADEAVQRIEPASRALPLEQRVEAVRNFYRPGDSYMTVESRGDGCCLVERNCPFYNVAMQRPAICDVSVNAMSRILGVRVERERSFQNGDGCCLFRVFGSQPVDPNQRLSVGESSVKQAR